MHRFLSTDHCLGVQADALRQYLCDLNYLKTIVRVNCNRVSNTQREKSDTFITQIAIVGKRLAPSFAVSGSELTKINGNVISSVHKSEIWIFDVWVREVWLYLQFIQIKKKRLNGQVLPIFANKIAKSFISFNMVCNKFIFGTQLF